MGSAQQQEVSCECYLHTENSHQRLPYPEHLIDILFSSSLAFGEMDQML